MDAERKLRLIWSHDNKGIRSIGYLQIVIAVLTAMIGFGFLTIGSVRANAILAFVVAVFMFVTGVGNLIRK